MNRFKCTLPSIVLSTPRAGPAKYACHRCPREAGSVRRSASSPSTRACRPRPSATRCAGCTCRPRPRSASAPRRRSSGYEADPIARALAGGETGVVGLLVGSLADFWNQELVRAVQRELHAADRSTLVADADGEPARELELAQRLVDHRVDGLVVVPIGPGSGGWAAIAEQIPTVTIGDALTGVAAAGEVVFDNRRGVEDTLRHLGGLGHRRVTVLSWAVETSPDRQAERAVAETAARPGARLRGRRDGVLAERLAPARARAAARARPADRRLLPVGLDRLRRLRRVHGARPRHPRRRRGRRVRRPPDLAPAHAAADLDVLGRRARGGGREAVPARDARGRRHAPDAARGPRPRARHARLDDPRLSVSTSTACSAALRSMPIPGASHGATVPSSTGVSSAKPPNGWNSSG